MAEFFKNRIFIKNKFTSNASPKGVYIKKFGTSNNDYNVFMNDTISEHTRKNGHTRSGSFKRKTYNRM
jgi:hypothetical protein